MPDTPMHILSDTTLVTTLPYAALFALAKQAATSLGGKLKATNTLRRPSLGNSGKSSGIRLSGFRK
jgi:hypothetical protein